MATAMDWPSERPVKRGDHVLVYAGIRRGVWEKLTLDRLVKVIALVTAVHSEPIIRRIPDPPLGSFHDVLYLPVEYMSREEMKKRWPNAKVWHPAEKE
jgi:hypothetical protein